MYTPMLLHLNVIQQEGNVKGGRVGDVTYN